MNKTDLYVQRCANLRAAGFSFICNIINSKEESEGAIFANKYEDSVYRGEYVDLYYNGEVVQSHSIKGKTPVFKLK